MKSIIKGALPLSLFVLSAVVAACSSSSSTTTPAVPCNQNPWECSSGQTCWLTDATGDYACLNSGPGKKGASCTAVPGSPPCGDGLFCLETSATSAGTCLSFCDPANPAHACAADEVCEAAAFNNNPATLVHLCTVPTPAGMDAGTDTGAVDAGTDASDAGPADTGSDATDASDASDAGASDATTG